MHLGLCLCRMRAFLRGREGAFPGSDISYSTALTLLELRQTKQTMKPNKPLSETAECGIQLSVVALASGGWHPQPCHLWPRTEDDASTTRETLEQTGLESQEAKPDYHLLRFWLFVAKSKKGARGGLCGSVCRGSLSGLLSSQRWTHSLSFPGTRLLRRRSRFWRQNQGFSLLKMKRLHLSNSEMSTHSDLGSLGQRQLHSRNFEYSTKLGSQFYCHWAC